MNGVVRMELHTYICLSCIFPFLSRLLNHYEKNLGAQLVGRNQSLYYGDYKPSLTCSMATKADPVTSERSPPLRRDTADVTHIHLLTQLPTSHPHRHFDISPRSLLELPTTTRVISRAVK